MSGEEREVEGRRECPDGGRCHHRCGERGWCFRVLSAGPLSGVYPDDDWPVDVVGRHALARAVERRRKTACGLCGLLPARGWASATVDGELVPLCHPPRTAAGHRDCYREWTVYGRRPVGANVVLGEE